MYWQSSISVVRYRITNLAGTKQACQLHAFAIVGDNMRFDFDEWRQAIFAMALGVANMNELLEATGLIDPDYL